MVTARRIIGTLASGLVLSGCVIFRLPESQRYDARSIAMQTVSVFNQRQQSSFAKQSWKGDWLFRRERLELIDGELRNSRPDLIVFQELMAKRDSSSESDQAILSVGALKDYDWDLSMTQNFPDTQEDEHQGVAAGLPLKVVHGAEAESEKFWSLGQDGFLTLSVIELDDHLIHVFAVQMPSHDNLGIWYDYLEELLKRIVDKNGICLRRMIVVGYLPGGLPLREFQGFLKSLELKDTSAGRGLCEVQSDCYTGTPLNELFMVTSGSVSPGQFDRILVHESAIVNSSGVIYNKPSTRSSEFAALYGMTKLWPTRRFGWRSSIRLSQCEGS